MSDMLCWIDRDGKEACMELEDDPQPQHPLIRTANWVPVRCPECGKLLCEVSPGSTVKVKCRQCRVYVEKVAA